MRFQNFELDVKAFQLREDGRPVRLERIPMELLVLLAENSGRLITRDEIVARIWGDNHFIERESAINTAIRKLRRALKEDPAHPRLIETVPAKGYRFVAPPDEAPPVRPGAEPHPEAMRSFLRGRHHWNQKNARAYTKAIAYFREAIDHDAAFAPAHVGLAYCYLNLGIHGLKPARDVYPLARAAARAALEIDVTSAEAVTALADVTKGYEWNFADSETEFQRAIQLNPGYAVAHQWYANLLSIMGRHDEAIEQAEEAHRCDPLSVGTSGFVGYTFYRARRFEEALRACTATVELHPDAPIAAWFMALVLIQMHRHAEAEDRLARTLHAADSSGMHLALLAFAKARAGNRAGAEQILQELQHPAGGRYISPFDIGTAYLGLGDAGSAVAWIHRAIEERVMRATELPMPLFDEVRADPALAAFCQSLSSTQMQRPGSSRSRQI
ncbi:MAG: winged helix-turn-helix domain-containing protein [Terracidiphilus sp.]